MCRLSTDAGDAGAVEDLHRHQRSLSEWSGSPTPTPPPNGVGHALVLWCCACASARVLVHIPLHPTKRSSSSRTSAILRGVCVRVRVESVCTRRPECAAHVTNVGHGYITIRARLASVAAAAVLLCACGWWAVVRSGIFTRCTRKSSLEWDVSCVCALCCAICINCKGLKVKQSARTSAHVQARDHSSRGRPVNRVSCVCVHAPKR